LPEGETCADDEEFERFLAENAPSFYVMLPDSYIDFYDLEQPLKTSMMYPQTSGVQPDSDKIKTFSYDMEIT
jgi:hypothetical protein